MTVRELWKMTVFVGDVVIEDDTHHYSKPLRRLKGINEVFDFMTKDELSKEEVNYFDFVFNNVMRIVLVGVHNEKQN
jgi:hypothetical protein